jgi:hypothetical protein
MKKVNEKQVREFLEPVRHEDYEVHPSGLIIPSDACDGFESSIYDRCRLAVLPVDTFSDAFHFTLENHIPELLLAAFEDRIAGLPVLEPLRDTVALALECIDWSAFEDECDDDIVTALMTSNGEIFDYEKPDGFMMITFPSGNLITTLIQLHGKAHEKWVKGAPKARRVA